MVDMAAGDWFREQGHGLRTERTESGRRWRCVCECGWGLPRFPGDTPPTSATETVAMSKGMGHARAVRKAINERHRMGLPTNVTRAS